MNDLNFPLKKLFPELELDHIGIAVKNLEESLKFYEMMGWQKFDIETVATEKVRVGFVRFQNQANIELLEPTSTDSVIAQFLQKRGPGVHHLCFRTGHILMLVQKLKAFGVRLINEEPRPGAHGCKVVFIHPSSAGGVLIELSEPAQLVT